MERWISKPRVMLALCLVLLSAALNRSDPLLYGLFLFLSVLSVLALALPWASMRGVVARASGRGEVVEGEAPALQLALEQTGWWPVFMIEVETHWVWAGRRTVLRHTVPWLRRGRVERLGSQMRFACRGLYTLKEVQLHCGFPLGLFSATRRLGFADVAFTVLPKPAFVVLPGALGVAADEHGNQLTRRLGRSQELGVLREYEVGDPVGRIHWRASARVGHLVIQHMRQTGSSLLRVAVELPDATACGLPGSAGEQAVRAAAGVALAAQAQGVRLRVYLPGVSEALTRADDVLRGLAAAAPEPRAFEQALVRAANDLRDGEHLVAVVGADASAAHLISMLTAHAVPVAQVIVCVAGTGPSPTGHRPTTDPLTAALAQAGLHVLPSLA